MRLVRYGEQGQEKPGLLNSDGSIRDLSQHVDDLGGQSLSPESLKKLRDLDARALPLVAENVRLGPCVANPGKFIAIGLNYTDHALETGLPVPKEPVVFYKSDTCICGHRDDIIQPLDSTKLDWEIEIAVVIGSKAQYIEQADAEQYIAGYCIVNDISERSFQIDRGGSQWGKGKGCDTFGPMGPWLVTGDQIEDVQNLDMWLDVNGERMQTGNTRTMIFSCAYLVSYLSRFMTLMPGDVVTTGTPPGVGLGMNPSRWLQPGDILTSGITGLGEQCQTVLAYSAS
ncbi:MAG: fumarylacetoacetate hydrolase family protein [Arenicellales bacterium]|jgi:2-keto-4-pentenoate hydratase/2-oxohepta-3-ene-1,7-dioic acid hydratase in catechol pathway